MNPVDYETEEYQAEQEAMDQNQSAAAKSGQADALAGSGNKRKFSPGGETGARRAAAKQRVDPGDLPVWSSKIGQQQFLGYCLIQLTPCCHDDKLQSCHA